MRKKKRQTYVQGTLFGADEMIKIRSCRQTQYSDYIRGMVDMFLCYLRTSGLPRDQTRIRNLPRPYMEALVKAIIKDRQSFEKFASGCTIEFVLHRDQFKDIRSIQAKIKAN